MDTAAALCTGNYYFFAAIAKRYPHCDAKIFLPENYLPIILLGIVQDITHSVTTNLLVAFQFHLPCLTKDGSIPSFVVATGPHVSVNMILGLPLITANGMVINTIETITLPAIDDGTTTHYIEFEGVHSILKKTHTFVAGVCDDFQ